MSDKNEILKTLSDETLKLGDIKKLAKTIKTDHKLALALFAEDDYHAKLLASLILDKKLLTQEVVDLLVLHLEALEPKQINQITDWLLANQFMKDRHTQALLESWQHHQHPILQRLFWYHQARLRWTGQTPPENSEQLLKDAEASIESKDPSVQWAMNFCVAQIGIHESQYRQRCIQLGESTGLYKDEKCPKHCVPNYLPEFIRIEVAKLESK